MHAWVASEQNNTIAILRAFEDWHKSTSVLKNEWRNVLSRSQISKTTVKIVHQHTQEQKQRTRS